MPSNDQADVIRYLNRIHDVAAHACGSAPAGMAARWAQNYIDNDYNRRQDELDLGAKGDNTEGGASLVRIVDSYRRMLDTWKSIPGSLPDTSGKASAQDIYDAFDRAVDEYWAIIRRTGEGLRLEGTQRIIGGEFKSILETHRSAFNAAAPKLVAATSSLGNEKHAKIQEWVDRTGPKFDDAINAARGR